MSAPKQPDLPPKGQFLVHQTEDGQVKIDVRLQGETAWLTQAHMAALFQTTVPNVNMHLRNIFAEGELQADSVIQEFLITAADGKRYRTNHYNLDAIISVGYRVKSAVATRFRIWATQKLLVRGRFISSPDGRSKGEGAKLEQTIAGSLPLPVGEDRGEGAQRVAEILEA